MSERDSKLSAEQKRELLERYAPVLRFSAGERFFPTRVDDYVRSCDALFVSDPHKDGRPQRLEKDRVHEGEPDPHSYLRFVARDDGPGSTKESIPKMAHGGDGVPDLLGQPPTKVGTPNAIFVLGGVPRIMTSTLKPALIRLGTLLLCTFLGCVALWWLFNISNRAGRLISAGLVFTVSIFLSKNDRVQTPLKMLVSLPRIIARVFEILLQDRKSLVIAVAVHSIFSFSNFVLLRLLTDFSVVASLLIAPAAALPLGVFYYALITDSAGVIVQLKSGRSVKWADEAYRKYRKEIVDGSEQVCTYYGRVVPFEGQGWTVLQYHYFYAFNDWRRYGGMNLHEGDWESVSVYVPGHPPQDGTQPYGVAYSQHHGKEFLLWEHTERFEDANDGEFHPVVFVALGSHANYPFADSRIDPSEMERFGLLQNTVSRIELQVRRIGLFGGRLPADAADGLGLHLDPTKDAPGALKRYFEKLDQLDRHRFNGQQRRQRFSKLWWTDEERRCIKGQLEPIADDSPGWVAYRGLWGDRTDVPDESGPSGPRWEKVAHGKLNQRSSWKDPLGWLEERKVDAFEAKASEDLEEIVTHMWELKASPPSEPLAESGHSHPPPRHLDAFLDHQDATLLIFGASRDVNRTILLRLAELQMWRVREGKDKRIPVILPLSPRALSRTRTAGAAGTASETAREVTGGARVVALMEWMAAELSALYGLPASVFYQWIEKKEFGETAGDATGVLLFVELEAEGLSDEWKDAFRHFATHNRVVVSLDGKDYVDLGLSHAVEAPAPETERVAAASIIDGRSQLGKLDDLTTAERERLCNWLSWLARRLQEHGQRLYQVDRMQPGWLAWRSRLVYYFIEWLIPFLIVGVITWQVMVASVPVFYSGSLDDAYRIFRYDFGLLFGAATGIAAWLAAHRRFGLFWAAIPGAAYTLAVYRGVDKVMEVYHTPPYIGPLTGLVFGVAVALAYLAYGSGWHGYTVRQAWDRIELYEARNVSWRRALRGAATGVLFGFVLLVFVSQGESLSAILLNPSDQSTVWDAPVFQLADAFGIATVLGMGFYLLLLFGKAHREPNQDRLIAPYQRITRARDNAIITGLLGAIFISTPYMLGASITLSSGQHDAPVSFADFKAFAVWLGMLAGTLAGLATGGLTTFQHYALRFVLRISRRDPYKMLKQAQACDLLVTRGRVEQDQGGRPVKRGDAYEFASSALMDYFAGL